MACFHPVRAYWTGRHTLKGEREIVFSPSGIHKLYAETPIQFACGIS